MKPAWPDWAVLAAILLTLLVVIGLAFSLRPSRSDAPPLLWRSPSVKGGDSLQI